MSVSHLEENSLLVTLSSKTCRYPGEHVSGDLYLNLTAPMEVEDIELRIWGRERTFWKDEAKGIHYFGHHSIFKCSKRILASPNEDCESVQLPSNGGSSGILLAAGQHSWRFVFKLPDEIPATFDFSSANVRGNVKYKVKGCLLPATNPSLSLGVWTKNTQQFLVQEEPDDDHNAAGAAGSTVCSKSTALKASCRAESEVTLKLDINNHSRVKPGKDFMLNAEVVYGDFKVTHLDVMLVHHLKLRSHSRHSKSLDTNIRSESIKLSANAADEDLTLADLSQQTLWRSIYFQIPRHSLPTCNGNLIRSNFELVLRSKLKSNGFLPASGIVSVKVPIFVISSSDEDEEAHRAAVYGFKTISTSSPPIVLNINEIPSDVGAMEPPFLTETTDAPPPPSPQQQPVSNHQSSAPVSPKNEWTRIPNTNKLWRWVEEEPDEFPVSCWGPPPSEVQIIEQAPFVKCSKDLGVMKFKGLEAALSQKSKKPRKALSKRDSTTQKKE